MKSRFLRFAGAIVLSAATVAPAFAGPGWGGGGGYYGGRSGYHGGYYGGGGHHHGGSSSADGWIIGGALALVTAGLLLSANNDQPAYGSYSTGPAVQVGSNGYVYSSPGYATYDNSYNTALTQTPSYAPPPVYQEPVPSYTADPAAVNMAPMPQQQQQVAQANQARGSVDCRRYAMNESGFDPSSANPWTTQIMIDSYNRSLQTCRDNRWGN